MAEKIKEALKMTHVGRIIWSRGEAGKKLIFDGAAAPVETDDIGVTITAGAVDTKRDAEGIKNHSMVLIFNIGGKIGDLFRSGRSLSGAENGNITVQVALDGRDGAFEKVFITGSAIRWWRIRGFVARERAN